MLFLPAFFAFTGMRTQIGLVSGVQNWLLCGVIIRGRVRRASSAARCRRATVWPRMARFGRARHPDEHARLVELIVLNIGLDLE